MIQGRWARIQPSAEPVATTAAGSVWTRTAAALVALIGRAR